MNKVKTYTAERFTKVFIEENNLTEILKSDYQKFFITREEVMIHRMKLPIRPTRMTTHALMYITSGNAEMIIGSSTYNVL